MPGKLTTEAANSITDPFGFLKPLLKILVSVVVAVLGCFLFGMIGSMTYPGVGALVGAGGGLLVFGLIASCAMGLWKDLLPAKVDGTTLVPKVVSHAVCKHGHFSLIVTVHSTKNVKSASGWIPFAPQDYYATVQCGNNPIKSTCVKTGAPTVWNEQFKIVVQPSDASMIIRLLDQDLFNSDIIGHINLDIDEHVIAEGFPQNREYPLQSSGKDKSGGKGVLVLSFDPGEDYPKSSVQTAEYAEKQGTYANVRQDRLAKTQKEWQEYGSCAKLSTTMFNTKEDISQIA